MNPKIQTSIIMLATMAAITLSAYAQDANTILSNMDKVLYGPQDMTGTNRIVLIDQNGKEEVREADVKQKGTDKRIMRFTARWPTIMMLSS